MLLGPGSRLGPYEVLAPLGRGGMGEVYRARDTKLNRDVALKILPELPAVAAASGLGCDDRRARFQREAELLASLNHPSIASIYGLEDSTTTTALVLELVEGPTLADRIAEGAVPIEEALPIAQQIANALDAAHERGVIHRDLKPANIKLRADGMVKVLDFGLAKLLDPAGAAAQSGNVSLSPTLSVHATAAGLILGTAAYMSPEQARGRPVDRRADIWAFGCVLFEMLAGTRPFDGDDIAEIIGAVIHKQPAWERLPAISPHHVRTVIERCLEKDPKQRIRDIGDVKLALGGAFQSAVPRHTAAPTTAGRTWSPARLAAGGVALMLAASVITAAVAWTSLRPAPVPISRFAIVPTGTDTVTAITADRNVAISPDGSRIVYVGNNGTALYVRPIDRLETWALVSPGAPRGPFISPDGQWVGFFDGRLKKVAMSGGPPIDICSIDGQRRGGTWSEDGTIVFATGNRKTGLWRVPAAGGEPQPLTTPNADGELDHVFPEFLPGGRSLLFTIIPTTGAIDAAQIAVLDLVSGTFKVVLKGGSQASYAATGHLVYGAGDTLRAVPFDLKTLTVTGAPVPVVARAATTASGAAHFALSSGGTLAYMPEGADESERTLVWMDRTGRVEPISAPARVYRRLRLSPDGTRLALDVADEGEPNLWIWDLGREALTRLTFGDAEATNPVWTPDSRSVLFATARTGSRQLFRQSADGAGSPEPLAGGARILPSSTTPDGTSVVLVNIEAGENPDLEILTLDSHRRRQAITRTPTAERNAEVSPDGRWIAYEGGGTQAEGDIFVRPFPKLDTGHWQISAGGGRMPVWSRDGRELFYVTRVGGRDQSSNPATLMRVRVEGDRAWSAARPEKLFDSPFLADPGPAGRTYDVAPDGRRFVLIRPPRDTDVGANARRLIVVQHWFAELAAAVQPQ